MLVTYGGWMSSRTFASALTLVAASSLVALCVTGVASAAPPRRAACTALAPPAVAHVGGIQWAAKRAPDPKCPAATASGGPTQPSPAYQGSPPLTFHGGLVTGTTTPGELTVTPVYWVPSGGAYSIPAGYETLINQFVSDAGLDSGKNLSYHLHAGTPITDADPFPSSGCTPDTGAIWSDGTPYSACITNAQLLAEASAFTTANSLPNNDLAHLYVFFLPKGVETCFTAQNGANGGTCSLNTHPGFCGYHAFNAPPLVADMNYAIVDSPTGWTCSSDAGSNTGGNESPNANIAADSEISIASHEITETITDPKGTGWWDGSGNEIGDECAYVFGDSSSFRGTPGALYNQTINGHHYFVQEEFSNSNFSANSTYSCIQEKASAITSASTTTFTAGHNGAFTVTTTSLPSSTTLTETGALPSGVTFADNHDGTATFAGAAAAGTGGSYPILVTASNGTSPDATQQFVLIVDQVPAITSGPAATFTVGRRGTFTVRTTGYPKPALTKTGTLPAGLAFVDNHNGTATLTGTPAARTGRTYPLVISAHNGIGSDAAQHFTLAVDQTPVFTSAAGATFVHGRTNSFRITAVGPPKPGRLAMRGALPAGVTFRSTGGGVGTLSGNPRRGGPYHLAFQATNAVGTTKQAFLLRVR